ncbi:SAM hydrolase/SAM-dependent halogenase family protein [Massilimicrobiota timonensis]|uniref:SAM hydrolase/SAM-dependent halogenase family protein n=1 Tax=Massilimicrobiota timonensis TaxID=1776392 RepID=UPI001960F44E|nr:SAM-dependent chlorinase/fluorinase [Massilimicrobiota timonensis]MBM6966755.1 SAM-dependent chlorinase/fluorinase [Massilimicrobiota timonensis]
MKPCIVWQTDFSLDWPFVATMKGVCKQVDASLECVDSTHTIEKFNVLEASQQLNYVEPFWPKGTVFVSVVDPGVGTPRKASVALLKDGNYVVTPDNGTLTHMYYNIGIEAIREIDETKNRYQGTESVSVFHGRDLFAYTAAKLASGQITFEEVGESYSLDDIILLDYEYLKADVKSEDVQGIVSNVSDPFGSIVFNVLTEDFNRVGYHEGDYIHVVLENEQGVYFDETVPYAKSFGFVDIGQPVIFNSSSNYISIGLNQGSFKDVYQVKAGLQWKVQFHKVD